MVYDKSGFTTKIYDPKHIAAEIVFKRSELERAKLLQKNLEVEYTKAVLYSKFNATDSVANIRKDWYKSIETKRILEEDVKQLEKDLIEEMTKQ